MRDPSSSSGGSKRAPAGIPAGTPSLKKRDPERLAQALRANLLKRKAQNRNRNEPSRSE